jgi:hypothetical protein
LGQRRRIGSVALMAGTISMGARREVLSAVAEGYWSAGRVEKGCILDALAAPDDGLASQARGAGVAAARRREGS